jgi:membrane-associated protease RseP (regulator of RpoE activity)
MWSQETDEQGNLFCAGWRADMKWTASISARRLLGLFLAALAYLAVVCLHECGHWSAARLVGYHVQCFRLGLGEPHVVVGSCLGTEIKVSPWLLGGAVQVRELMPPASNQSFSEAGRSEAPREWKSILVLSAGPLTSFVLAFLLAFYSFGARGPAQAAKSAACLCLLLCLAVFRALAALLSFRQQRLDSRFDYCPLACVPWKASESANACLLILISTCLSQAVFNFLPLPALDGGKIFFELLDLIPGGKIDPSGQTLLVVLCQLLLFVAFFAAVYRGFCWPFPEGLVNLDKSKDMRTYCRDEEELHHD